MLSWYVSFFMSMFLYLNIKQASSLNDSKHNKKRKSGTNLQTIFTTIQVSFPRQGLFGYKTGKYFKKKTLLLYLRITLEGGLHMLIYRLLIIGWLWWRFPHGSNNERKISERSRFQSQVLNRIEGNCWDVVLPWSRWLLLFNFPIVFSCAATLCTSRITRS